MSGEQQCARCQTELPASLLSCPACGALVHAERLRDLAATADGFVVSGRLSDARSAWQETLELLPVDSRQHQQIRERVAELNRQVAAAAAAPSEAVDRSHPWWNRAGFGALATAGLLLGKGKFLALGLLKAKTFFSMLAFAGVYWSAHGWPLALGLVVSIYIHEMGHVAMLKQFGIAADAPLFIPGVGALVLLKQRIDDPVVDARIGLAGPIWGLGAGIGAYLIAALTGNATWRAIAELTGFINLFNLIPIWQLDGSRAFHALSQAQRLAVVAAIIFALLVSGQKLLLVVGAVALYRGIETTTAPGDTRTAMTFAGLIVALSWLARGVGN